MGVTYSVGVIVGFEVTTDVLDRFEVVKPAVSRMEDRYDAKTGKFIGQVEVTVSHAEEVYVDGEDEFDYRDELVEHLTKKYNLRMLTTEIDTDLLVVGPSPQPEQHGGWDVDRLETSGSLKVADVVALGPELERVRKLLVDWGANPGEPMISVVAAVG